MKIYADHAATTQMRESAKAAMIECLEEYGNPSSIHAAGRVAAMKLESARKEVADGMDLCEYCAENWNCPDCIANSWKEADT